MQYKRFYDILTDVQHIIDPDTIDYSLDPTPIRQGGVRVVKEVPVTESSLHKDGSFYKLLTSLVRKRKSEEIMSPVRLISPCFDGVRATNTVIESNPPSEMRFLLPDLLVGGEENLFHATKRLKTMNRAAPIVPPFANIFDQHHISKFAEEQTLSSCFDDMLRAPNNTANESNPLSETLFPGLRIGGEEHFFPTIKRLNTMNRVTPIPLQGSTFANIFDQEDINTFTEEEQALPEEASKIPSARLSHRNSITNDESSSQAELRFRGYQFTRWSHKFEELKSFHQKYGHCQVDWKANPLLSQWIKRQRYQYKLKQDGRHSTMTVERVAALEEVGLSWDSHKAAWDEKFNELVLFKVERGHCSVHSNFPENPQLSIWVKGQRRHLRLSQSGKMAAMDAERIAKLNDIGFCWSLRENR
jgi:hypothetical protein